MTISELTVKMSPKQSTALQAQGLHIVVAKMIEVNGNEEYNVVFKLGTKFNVITTPCNR